MSQRGKALWDEQGVEAYLLGVVLCRMVADLATEVVSSLCLGHFVDVVMRSVKPWRREGLVTMAISSVVNPERFTGGEA